jgi:hypothetical protein
VDGRIILKCILKMWDGDMDWITLSQDRDRWRALAYTVINLWVPQKIRRISRLTEDLLTSQEGLCSTELKQINRCVRLKTYLI